MAVFCVSKKAGETLAELLVRFRKEKNLSSEEPLTYAGRLDPLAEGLVIVLSEKDRFEKEKYLALDKQYEVTVLFGVLTDTLDPLGVIETVKANFEPKEIIKRVEELEEITEWAYPDYSSKLFDGKPRFLWAREGKSRLLPHDVKHGKIVSVTAGELNQKTSEEILHEVKEKIAKVYGDFRQDEIIATWNEKFPKNHSWFLCNLTIACESGIYMREVARVLGEKLGTCAIAYNIRRSKVGPYSL